MSGKGGNKKYRNTVFCSYFNEPVTFCKFAELQHSDNTRVICNLDVINDAISKNKKSALFIILTTKI